MGTYRKKPVVVEAVQWNGQNRSDIVEFVGDQLDAAWSVGGYCFINTLEGRMNAAVGDWIIRGVQGEFYPCKPDIFEATYEAVASTDTSTEAALPLPESFPSLVVLGEGQAEAGDDEVVSSGGEEE